VCLREPSRTGVLLRQLAHQPCALRRYHQDGKGSRCLKLNLTDGAHAGMRSGLPAAACAARCGSCLAAWHLIDVAERRCCSQASAT
jgi:hypothetical protein